MRRIALALSLVFIVPLLAAVHACTNQARAGEELTTWRAGDPIVYRTGCFEPAPILQIGHDGQASEATRRGRRCFWMRTQVPAVLLEWIDGPFVNGGTVCSAWRIRDAQGDEVFILLADEYGPHQAAEGT